MLFVAGTPFRHMLLIGGIGAGALFGIYSLGKSAPEMLPRFSTWASRIEQFAGGDAAPEAEVGGAVVPATSSMEYQIELAQVAIHRGGLLPHGPGTGASRNFLPHPYSDMIFAFIVEEWGAVLGGLGLVLLYLILLYRSLRVAYRCQRFFGALLAAGLSFMLVLQAMTNMAVAVRLFPTTGQPLPVVSYGGTSLIFTCLSIGIILAVSRSVTDPEGWERAHGVPA
jgi:cell division protein FtsW